MSEREELMARIEAIDAAMAQARDELVKAQTERSALAARLGALNTAGTGAGATQAIPAVAPDPRTSEEIPSNVTELISPSDIPTGLHPMLRLAGTFEPHLVWTGSENRPREVQEAICGVRDDPRRWEYPPTPFGDRIEVHLGCLQAMRRGPG